MYRRFLIVVIFSCVFSMPTMLPEQEDREYWYQKAKTAIQERMAIYGSKRERAKNVIFLIGDGMGVTTLTAARIFKGQRQGKFGEDLELAWEKFPALALTKTYNLDAQVGESSACATALLCGVKTNFETVGLDGKGRFENCFSSFTSRVDSLIDWAQQEGKSTGIVTNTRLTHATPAALYSHSSSRYWEDDSKVTLLSRKSCKDIARQLVEDDPGRHINVLLGGGRRHWLPKVSNDPEQPDEEGRRLDGRNLIEDWLREKKKRGVKAEYVWKKSQLDQINPSKVDQLLGLFAYSHMDFETDRDKTDDGDPSLSEMTMKALGILNKNQKGYFLFVESGRIDHAHHFNNPFRALEETLVLESTLLAILSVVNLQETLIVLTSDHSHVLTLGGVTTPKGNNILGMDNKVSDVDKMPYSTLLYGNGPGFSIPRQIPTNLSVEEKNAVHGAAVPRKWATHGGEDVPVYAIGPLSSVLFTGTVDQSYIPHAIAYVACFSQFRQRCLISNEIPNSSQISQQNCIPTGGGSGGGNGGGIPGTSGSDNSSGRSAVVLASSVLGNDESRSNTTADFTSHVYLILFVLFVKML